MATKSSRGAKLAAKQESALGSKTLKSLRLALNEMEGTLVDLIQKRRLLGEYNADARDILDLAVTQRGIITVLQELVDLSEP